MLSAKMEDYIKTIYDLQRQGEGPVSTSDVADELDVTPPTATSMMETLEVHDEADRLEHHISEEFERRVADVLGDPEVDPHGDPIPNDALEPVEESVGTVLGAHEEGATVVVQRVRDRDPEELRYLQEAGISPGTELHVEEVAPIGMVTVRLATGETVSLPDEVANAIRVRALEDGVEDRVDGTL
jgi:DtxR family Mn-dependent transcriptional regulator